MGFALENPLLIIAGALDGSSGLVVEPTFCGPETLPGHSTTYWGLLSQPDKQELAKTTQAGMPGRNACATTTRGDWAASRGHSKISDEPGYHMIRKTMMPCQRPVPMSENEPRVPLKVPKLEGSVAL